MHADWVFSPYPDCVGVSPIWAFSPKSKVDDFSLISYSSCYWHSCCRMCNNTHLKTLLFFQQTQSATGVTWLIVGINQACNAQCAWTSMAASECFRRGCKRSHAFPRTPGVAAWFVYFVYPLWVTWLQSPNVSVVTTNAYDECSFKFAGPHLWNNLPLHTKQATTSTYFKTLLKRFLFKSSYM